MTATLTPGKKRGLEAVSDSRGIIAAIAIDQRNALRNLFSKALNVAPDAVAPELLIQFKEAVSQVLTPHASAILLDPEYGLPAASCRAQTAGLLLAYEQTGYDKSAPGRMPRLLEGWSVKQLRQRGADCVKVLLYFSIDSPAEVNIAKKSFVVNVGQECLASDIPFFLEIVSYAEGLDEKGAQFARIKPQVVTRAMAEFSDPRYCVDVLKIGMPVNLAYVEGSPGATDAVLYRRREAVEHFAAAAAAARLPFIYLSEGVSNESFQFGLELAAEARSCFSGVLCGRATWKDGVPVFITGGRHALDDWLATYGVRNVHNINSRLSVAAPWFRTQETTSMD